MMNITPKVAVGALIVTMILVISSFGPDINSSKDFRLSDLNIDALVRAVNVSRARAGGWKDGRLASAEGKQVILKTRNKKKKKRGGMKRNKDLSNDIDGGSPKEKLHLKESRAKRVKQKAVTMLTGHHETERPDESNGRLENGTSRGSELRSQVLKIREANNPERQRRLRVSPLKSLLTDEWWPTLLEPSYGKFFADLNLTSYSDEDAVYLKERLSHYERRARQVSKVCSTLPRLRRRKVRIKTLVFDTRHTPNLVWCQLPKIASSSWNTNFFMLGHGEDEENVTAAREIYEDESANFNLHHEVFRLFPPPSTTKERSQVFSGALRFMIVRHPFVRLISAYRDKMTQTRPKPVWFHYEKLQKFIINRYRSANSPEDTAHPTFAEFIQFVLDQTAGLESPKEWNRAVFGCWKPYYVSCGVCVHDIQMILKIETLEEDTEFLATIAGLSQLKKERAWLHHINNTSSSDVADDFFAQLTRSQAEELHERYRIDFDMFGYSPKRYIDVASHNEASGER